MKSVSMITDPIVRATYIKDCSSRLGINEQTLLVTMNNFIRAYRDEKRKEEERNNRALQRGEQSQTAQQQLTPTTQSPTSQNDSYEDAPPPEAFLPPEAFSQPQPSNPPLGGNISSPSGTPTRGSGEGGFSVQDLLIQFIIKYGEQVILDNVETDEGQTISLNVAQVAQIDLANDNLTFSNPLHTQILEEAVAHSGEEGFKTERYFRLHADYEISQLAIKLTEEPVQLTKTYQMKFEPERLKGQLEHLLLDVRFEFVENKLTYIRQEMGLCSGDAEKYMSLIGEMQRLQKLRMKIAKMLGRA